MKGRGEGPRRVVTLATAFAASVATGVSLLLVGAGSASASTSTTTTTNAPSSVSSTPGSPGGAASSSLGGFETSATGTGFTWTYEQPNFPVPATPTLEFHLGFSQTSYNFGPTGESLASTMWPGQAAANIGGQLSLVLSPYFGDDTPNIDVPPWPFQAATSYPAGPTTASSASQDSPGVQMESTSTQDSGTATSDFGSSSGGDDSSFLPSGFISVQSFGSTVQSTVSNGTAIAEGTSELHGVSIFGGLVSIGAITSTATSTSEGNTAQVSGTSTISNMTLAGQSVSLDSSGISSPSNSAPVLGPVLPSVEKLLQSAGITLSLTNPVDTVDGASGERVLDGVQLQIDLTTLDKQANQLAALLPEQIQSQVLSHLPLPLPNAQVMTVDLGTMDVKAAASPAYDAEGSSDSTGAAGTDNGSGSLGTTSLGDSGFTGTEGTPGTPGTTGTPGSTATSPNVGSGLTAASTPAKLFQGIGAGLIVLGVLLALLLAGVLWRADAAVAALTAAPPCVGEDPANLLGGT